MAFFSKLFGDPNKKILEKLEEQVSLVNRLEKNLLDLSDEELKQKVRERVFPL